MTSKYERIKNECKTRNILWEDPDFPAIQSSVFYYQTPPFTFQWRRIADFAGPQACFVNESENFDVMPGKMGDRWLVSCLGVLHSLRNLFYRVVPADQSLDKAHGVFRFRLWWCGEWVEVLVDDRLPTINGRLAFLQPQTSNCFWASLLEKAIAKLHGSYEALKYGTRSDGLSDLLGGVVECIPLKGVGNTTDVIRPQQLRAHLDTTCIVTCIAATSGTGHKSTSERLPNGIALNVNYRLCSLDKVETLLGDAVQLVRLRDPLSCNVFDTNSTTNGVLADSDWATMSSSWERVSVHERDRLFGQLDVGEFWMSFLEFTQVFTSLECIYLDADTAKDEITLQDRPRRWQMRMFQGQWKRGVSAGGCRNHESFHINPQLLLNIQEKQEVVIALNQHTAVEPKVIGFTMYKVNSQKSAKLSECLAKEFFKTQVSFLNSDYGNTRHVSYRCLLEVGQYVLMPTTYEPGEETQFTVRILGTAALRLSLLEIQTLMLLDPFPPLKQDSTDSTKLKSVCQYEPLFMQLADENKTINCFELHELLEACLPNDYIRGCANIDICRQVIALQDKSGSGRINFLQFKTFMVNLKSWHGVFKIYTKEKAGILRSERLRDALCDVGFQLSTDIMNYLMQRYIRKDGTLRLSDFAAAVLHLTAAFDYFQRKDHNQDNVIEVEMSEWIKCVLRC